jgi:LytTr DNA-binding domain
VLVEKKKGSEESPSRTDGCSKAKGTAKMLRITVVENAAEDQWTLQGTLTKYSVDELLSSWRASTCPSGRRRIVNLDKVTSIDKSGEEALSMIMRDGATVVASGVYTKHLLDELRARRAGPEDPHS